MTGTPIENRIDDLVNIFAFVDPDRIPPDTPAKRLPALTSDCILRRTKEDVVHRTCRRRSSATSQLELTPAQREAYDLAEKEGVVHLNDLGDTITVQHVFELVMRLKQICNFDPLHGRERQAGAAARRHGRGGRERPQGDRLLAVGRAAGDDRRGARRLTARCSITARIPQNERQPILDRFKADPTKHVLLMSYGTGSVGLNLQFTNYVFLFDRWWNPAVEDQAINRAHRIGQKDPVFVTRFLSEETIEARIAEVLEEKRQLFNDLLEQAEKPATFGADRGRHLRPVRHQSPAKAKLNQIATGSRALLGNPPTRSSASPSLIAEPKVRGENRTARVSRLIDFRDVLASVSEPHKCRRLDPVAFAKESVPLGHFPFGQNFRNSVNLLSQSLSHRERDSDERVSDRSIRFPHRIFR